MPSFRPNDPRREFANSIICYGKATLEELVETIRRATATDFYATPTI